MFDLEAFFIGGGIGLASAIIGALIDYRVTRRRDPNAEKRTPGCIFLVPGALGLLGLLVITASLLMSGEVARVLVAGLGVGVGFFLGFVLMTVLWFVWRRVKG
jgi:hypothetical protein